jgi:hypothetical protein
MVLDDVRLQVGHLVMGLCALDYMTLSTSGLSPVTMQDIVEISCFPLGHLESVRHSEKTLKHTFFVS